MTELEFKQLLELYTQKIRDELIKVLNSEKKLDEEKILEITNRVFDEEKDKGDRLKV